MLGVVLVAGIAVAGCDNVTKPKTTLSPSFGNAVRQNMAVQIVNPEASADIKEAPNLDGIRANTAVTEYQTGTVKETEEISTSDVSQ